MKKNICVIAIQEILITYTKRKPQMSDHRNQIILESLYQKYLNLGHENAEALELAAKEFEENSN